MINCKDCQNKTCLKDGKPCRKVENELKKVTVSRRDNKITIVNPQYMDKVAYVSSVNGKRKARIRYDDNWEMRST